MIAVKKEKLAQVCRGVAEIYITQRIPQAAAALSYFLTLTFFPMLICLYTMLGSLFPATEEVRGILGAFLPAKTVETILEYLRYVSENLNTPMLVMALTVLLTSSSAAFRAIDREIAEMRGGGRFTGLFALIFSFFFSLILLAVIYFSVLLIVTGKWFLEFADRYIMFMNISDSWSWWRFVLLFLLLFTLISSIYRITAPRRGHIVLLPGTVFASAALVGVSIAFSAIIGAGAKYPTVYGSLASVIVMMLWLYTCGATLFLGAALNVSVERLRR